MKKKKNLAFGIIFIFIFLITFTLASNNEVITICGGDNEIIIPCGYGNELFFIGMDDVSPNITIVFPTSEIYAGEDLKLEIMSSEPAHCYYSIDNGLNYSLDSSNFFYHYKEIEYKSNGLHNFSFYCYDTYLNLGTETIEVNVKYYSTEVNSGSEQWIEEYIDNLVLYYPDTFYRNETEIMNAKIFSNLGKPINYSNFSIYSPTLNFTYNIEYYDDGKYYIEFTIIDYLDENAEILLKFDEFQKIFFIKIGEKRPIIRLRNIFYKDFSFFFDHPIFSISLFLLILIIIICIIVWIRKKYNKNRGYVAN